MARGRSGAPASAALLRVSLAVAFLVYGAGLVFGAFGGPGLDTTADRIESSFGFAPGRVFAILLGGIVLLPALLLLMGLFTRFVVIPLALFSGLALLFSEWALLLYNSRAARFPAGLVLFAATLTIYFLGPGALALDSRLSREGR